MVMFLFIFDLVMAVIIEWDTIKDAYYEAKDKISKFFAAKDSPEVSTLLTTNSDRSNIKPNILRDLDDYK